MKPHFQFFSSGNCVSVVGEFFVKIKMFENSLPHSILSNLEGPRVGRVEKHPESEGEAQVSTPHCLLSDPDLATPTQQCPIPRAENHFHKEPPCLKGVGLIFLPVSVILVGLSARRQSCDHVGQSQLSLRDVTPGGRDECLWSWVIPRTVPWTPAA